MASAAQRVGRDVDDVKLVAVTKLQSPEVTQAWDGIHWPELIPPFAEISQMTNISAQGLMCMTPFFSDPETSRQHYRKLRNPEVPDGSTSRDGLARAVNRYQL